MVGNMRRPAATGGEDPNDVSKAAGEGLTGPSL